MNVDKQLLFILACAENNVSEARRLLSESKDLEIQPEYKNNLLLKNAVRDGRIEILQFLLSLPQVNPTSVLKQTLFDDSVLRNYIEVVRALLSSEKFTESLYFGDIMLEAVSRNFFQIVQLMLIHPLTNILFTLDPFKSEQLIIRAIESNSLETLNNLLQDGRLNPAASNNAPIRLACSIGNPAIVRMLLADRRVDPAAAESDALVGAARMGNCEVLQMLLHDGRADPSVRNNWALRYTVRRRLYSCVLALLQDYRVDSSVVPTNSLNRRMSNLLRSHVRGRNTRKALASEIRTRGRTQKIRNYITENLWADPMVVARREGVNLSRFAEGHAQGGVAPFGPTGTPTNRF